MFCIIGKGNLTQTKWLKRTKWRKKKRGRTRGEESMRHTAVLL